MPSALLPASGRKLLLTVDIAATVSVLGADLALLTLGVAGLGGANPLTIYPAAHLVSAWLVAPLALLSLGTGILLGLLTPWGLLRYWWVTAKLTLTAVLSGAVLFVLVPRLAAAAATVSAPAAIPLVTSERLPLVIAPAVASTLLLLMLVLAIYKPGGRLRARATSEAGRLGGRPNESAR
jgi:hypothetical protein